MTILRFFVPLCLILLTSLNGLALDFNDLIKPGRSQREPVIQDILPGEVFQISGTIISKFGAHSRVSMNVRFKDSGSPPYEILDFNASGGEWTSSRAKLIKSLSTKQGMVISFAKYHPVFLSVTAPTSFGINHINLAEIGSGKSQLKINRLSPERQVEIANRARPKLEINEDNVGKNSERGIAEASFKNIYIKVRDGFLGQFRNLIRITVVNQDGQSYFVEAKIARNIREHQDPKSMYFETIPNLSIEQYSDSIRLESPAMFENMRTKEGELSKRGAIKLLFNKHGLIANEWGLTVRRTLHGNSTVRQETVNREVSEVDVNPTEAKVRFVKTGFIYPSFIEVVNRVQECGRYYTN